MTQILIGIIGLFITIVIGYTTFCAYRLNDDFSFYEIIYLSPILFFTFITLIYIANLIAIGNIIANKLSFFIFFFCYMALVLALGHSYIKIDFTKLIKELRKKRYYEKKYKIGFLSLILIISVIIALIPIASGINFASDSSRHLMFTNQLLNGFPFSHHFPYKDIPSPHYPNLTHITIAFFVNLLNIHVFDAFYILHLFQAVFLPLGMYTLLYSITRNYWVALISMVFTAFYGGHFINLTAHSWWLNPAIERLNPSHITRMQSLVFFLFFIFLFHKTLHNNKNYRIDILAGSILGFTGLTHTYAFTFLVLFLTISLLLNIKNVIEIKRISIILLIGISLAGFGYFPTLWEKLISHDLNAIGQLSYCGIESAGLRGGQILILPFRFLIHYGIVGIMPLLSLLFIKKSKNRKLLILTFYTFLFIFVLTSLKEILTIVYGIKLPYHPTQHKYGKILFLVFVLMSGIFLNDFFRNFRFRQNPKSLMKIGIIILLAIFISAGTITTIKAAHELSSKKFISKANRKANIKLRKKNNITNLIRKHANTEDVIAVPDKIAKKFAAMSGLDILYMDHPKTYSRCRNLANKILFATELERNRIAQINGMDFNQIFEWILSHYKIRFLAVPIEDQKRYDGFPLLMPVDTGSWDGKKRYLIYRVNQPVDKINISIKNDAAFIATFENNENYNLMLGYYPIVRNRNLAPKIVNYRDLTVTGLTWSEEDIWISILEKKRLYNIHPEDGRVIRTLKNPVEEPGGIAWDGKTLWSTDTVKKRLIRLDPGTGDIMNSISFPDGNPKGLAWGQNHLWIASAKNQKIYKLSPSDGAPVSTYTGLKNPNGVAWHNDSLWVSTGWRGKIAKIALHRDSQKMSYFNNGYRITTLAWGAHRLWGADRRSSTLIEFRDIAIR